MSCCITFGSILIPCWLHVGRLLAPISTLLLFGAAKLRSRHRRVRQGKKWKPFGALGRVYVANEGINAQMSIPTNVLDNFMACCRVVPELGEHMENGINIDPRPLTMEEFQSAGDPVNEKPAPPFRNLHVRVRSQIVSDGLDKSLDWQSAGYDMPPMEWHQKIKEARETKESKGDKGA